jgi:2-polyprenyl-6-methoxyphenol hydroxylase-like FAD-dependent oxidoreductase
VEAAGIDVRWGTKVEAVSPDGEVRTDGETLVGEWVVGADGLLSHVRGWARLAGAPPSGRDSARRFGVRRPLPASRRGATSSRCTGATASRPT